MVKLLNQCQDLPPLDVLVCRLYQSSWLSHGACEFCYLQVIASLTDTSAFFIAWLGSESDQGKGPDFGDCCFGPQGNWIYSFSLSITLTPGTETLIPCCPKFPIGGTTYSWSERLIVASFRRGCLSSRWIWSSLKGMWITRDQHCSHQPKLTLCVL